MTTFWSLNNVNQKIRMIECAWCFGLCGNLEMENKEIFVCFFWSKQNSLSHSRMGRDHVVASKTRKLSSPLVWPHIYLPKKPRGVAANFLFPFAQTILWRNGNACPCRLPRANKQKPHVVFRECFCLWKCISSDLRIMMNKKKEIGIFLTKC